MRSSPAFTGLGAPHWHPDVHGPITGLSRCSAVAQTARAALGAAYVAGLTAGVWRDLDELSVQWKAERRFAPTTPRSRAAERMAGREDAVWQATWA